MSAERPAAARRDPESERLLEDLLRKKNWKRWGTYLADRQWGTVREDYSEDGDAWRHFPHAHARSRVYRWGEDGLFGLTDRQCRMCLSLALWNGKDPILKERLFGLTNEEGNHGEDVKELYFHLDATPTHSYAKALYKYPQAEFPYEELVQRSRGRGRDASEIDLEHLGVFDEDRYFDVTFEYAKRGPDDLLGRFTVENRGPEAAELHVLPTLWFRNVWGWGRSGEGYGHEPTISRAGRRTLRAVSDALGPYVLEVEPLEQGGRPSAQPAPFLFTHNETNRERLYGVPNERASVKDAFHDAVVHGRYDATSADESGTKAAAHFVMRLPPGGRAVVRVRLCDESTWQPLVDQVAEGARPSASPEERAAAIDAVFAERIAEADAFYATKTGATWSEEDRTIARHAWAGLLWTKQFYHYAIKEWLEGDPSQPPPPPRRAARARNREFSHHLYNRDIISVPDKWEYPWYAAWDLAFHMLPLATIDPDFAKGQLELFLREWYMHPNGQLPAYEWNLSDVNPPVHAWAAWRVYKLSAPRGKRDKRFLAHVFQKLLMNFTWWVNRKDEGGNNLFSGGFLGLDNIGLFDRSNPVPGGGHVEQADGTAWMAFYCTTMLGMAVELAASDPAYEDLASKFFEHFVAIAEAMNELGGTGLWNEEDGFYYDQATVGNTSIPLRVRSMVGIIPLFAVLAIDVDVLEALPGFSKRMKWFLDNRPDLGRFVTRRTQPDGSVQRLLAIPPADRLVRVLRYVLDEEELLSPHGVRSLSKAHAHPYEVALGGEIRRIAYVPGDSDSGMFGGNSNWRGPVWLPVNHLLIEALDRYHYFYGDSLKVECPTGSGHLMNLRDVATFLSRRVAGLFRRGPDGARPSMPPHPVFGDLPLFHEYFDGDTGRGVGAAHQTGWTALAVHALGR
ncbi:MAG: glucosidase [Myxococcales bacterium]|nr:glucosidase [Myxococcales bacterium]MBL0195853.1 glucosidase [Myxococcales bacterium]